MSQKKTQVVVVGGGTAGWMTAAAIVAALPAERVAVTLVESEAIGIIGVGEATLPHLRRFNENIGVNEAAFMSATQATFKLGIEFVDWARPGDAYIHPFGAYGVSAGGVGFHHYWRRLAGEDEIGSISEYSLPIVAAYQGRFDLPDEDPASPKSTYGYAYQFDSTRYAPFLRAHAETLGAQRIEGRVVNVVCRGDDGNIERVVLEDGREIAGDLFVDCSGFRGLLIEQTLKAGYENWQHWLPCDRAVALQCEAAGPPKPYTRATASAGGWRWRIPLQHRVGNGYVYCSEHLSEDQASADLLESLEGPAITAPKPLRFVTGKRRLMWHHNCVAVGLAGGFLEPLESTSIYLIQAAITHLVDLFPLSGDCALEREEYNRIMDREFVRIRDFLILHYHASERTDSAFWRAVRKISIPDSLAEKLELFRARGRVASYQQGLFLEPSWLAVLLGQRIVPAGYDQRVNDVPEQQLRERLRQLRRRIAASAASMPDHAEFLRHYCPAAA
ncbi:MAG: tryptophan halogenase family protein [Pseudomonadota bacterium]